MQQKRNQPNKGIILASGSIHGKSHKQWLFPQWAGVNADTRGVAKLVQCPVPSGDCSRECGRRMQNPEQLGSAASWGGSFGPHWGMPQSPGPAGLFLPPLPADVEFTDGSSCSPELKHSISTAALGFLLGQVPPLLEFTLWWTATFRGSCSPRSC